MAHAQDDEKILSTYFAPAEKAEKDEVEKISHILMENPIVRTILDAAGSYVLVLNEQRQVLAANPEVLEGLGVNDQSCLVGLRPGEAFNCLYFPEGPGGCGTSRACRTCGAVISILASSLENKPVVDECRMLMARGDQRVAAEFRVKSTPLRIKDYGLTVLVLIDISAQKRKEVLERVFFHDIQDILDIMRGLGNYENGKNPEEVARKIIDLSAQLASEIDEHKLLMLGEQEELELHPEKLHVSDILSSLQVIIESHKSAKGKNLDINFSGENLNLITDYHILMRVLANMVVNACESTESGGTVSVAAGDHENSYEFSVQNSAVIPEQIARHIFSRNFSTKTARGFGLGTYSMKLLGEHYLDGRISLSSDDKNGTVFRLVLPPNEDFSMFAENKKKQYRNKRKISNAKKRSALSEEVILSFELVNLLPLELVSRLRKIALLGEMEKLNLLIEEVENYDSNLAVEFKKLAKGHRYENLLELLSAGDENNAAK